jgi:hypothetical protein
MKNLDQQPHTRNIEYVLSALSEAPSVFEVKTSFDETLASVTKLSPVRIPVRAQNETRIISPYLMHLSHKTIGLGVAALAIVLIVGFATFGNHGSQDDIMTAALDEESSYEITTPDDTYGDLTEEEPSEELALAETPSTSGGSKGNSGGATLSVDASLTTIEGLFATDDIDDAALNTWFSDTSAAEGIGGDYTF